MMFDVIISGVLALVAGVLAPFVLIPIIAFTGWAVVVEEIAKAAVVWLGGPRLENWRDRTAIAVVFGLTFGVSESCLYFGQLIARGLPDVLLNRLSTTVPMHILTVLILTFGVKKEWYVKLSVLVVAWGVHAVFNGYVAPLIASI